MKKTIIGLLSILLLFVLAMFVRPPVSTAQSGGDPPSLISQVTVTRSSDQSAYVLESAEERIPLDANGTASVDLQLSPGDGIVRLRGPEGGLINGQRTIEIDTDQQGRNIALTFDPGNDTGPFFVEVADDRTSETVAQFWVGPFSCTAWCLLL